MRIRSSIRYTGIELGCRVGFEHSLSWLDFHAIISHSGVEINAELAKAKIRKGLF
jgi:hypothetical protein